MTWPWLVPLIAAAVLALAWLIFGPYRHALIRELPGLLPILAAGKPYRSQARRVMVSRARREAAQEAGALETLCRLRKERQAREQKAALGETAAVVENFQDAIARILPMLEQVVANAQPLRRDPALDPARYGAALCAERGHYIHGYGSPACIVCGADR